MLSRAGRIALLVFQAVWLNVIVPGHARGEVLVPGARGGWGAAVVPACCAARVGRDEKHQSPTEEQKSHCAVCFFAAHLMLPPVMDCRLAPMGLRELLPVPPPAVAAALDRPAVDHCRGPPVDLHAC